MQRRSSGSRPGRRRSLEAAETGRSSTSLLDARTTCDDETVEDWLLEDSLTVPELFSEPALIAWLRKPFQRDVKT
jgi:hypothetical protein